MISRRKLLSAGPLALAACGKHETAYFGKARRSSRQRLVFLNRSEPASLDPALVSTNKEVNITRCLFDGLTRNDSHTLAPRAALATHYDSERGGKLLTFYLRGHHNPSGTELPGANGSNSEQSARWSDGTAITADDFVYSWRRVVNPRTASPLASVLFHVKGGEDIYTGRTSSATHLAVEATDKFTLKVELRLPVPFFLNLAAAGVLAAVPRQAIEAAAGHGTTSSWTQPGGIVVSGPFNLEHWRPYDRIVLQKNALYYDAQRVRLEELCFLHVANGVTNVNLYKSGHADAMADSVLPPQLLPGLRGTQELQVRPALDTLYYFVSVQKPPFDNLLLRYALNMATDKEALARFAGAGRNPAISFVPPLTGYPSPQQLIVQIQGRACDVLSYDPAIARELLVSSGFSGGAAERLRTSLGYPVKPSSRERSEIIQDQWRRNLGIDVVLNPVEFSVWTQFLAARSYAGLAEWDWTADYADPDTFLSIFTSENPNNSSGWANGVYDGMLASANAETDAGARIYMLADCEQYLLRSMPVIPLYFDRWVYLQKPFVRGLEIDPLAGMTFQDAWIDTKWKP